VAQNNQMLRIGTDVAKPIALTWLDADNLLVLGQVGARKQLYEVPLNGGQSTLIATPHGVRSVAVSWPAGRAAPFIAIAIGQADSPHAEIQMSKTGLLNPDWRRVGKGNTPVFPG
jgi:hypothetical protein